MPFTSSGFHFLRFWRLLAGVLLALCLAMPSLSQVAVPPLKSRVTDLTGTLDAGVRQGLEARLAELEKTRGSQLAVLMLPSTQPEAIEQFSLRVAEAWKLGRKGVDDGVLLLVARDDRAVRIEVGYGLEGVIPDAVAKRVIEEVIVPRFRAGNFSGGVDAGVDALIKIIGGEPLPEAERGMDAGSAEDVLHMAMVFVFVLGGILRALFGALIGAGIAGAVAFFGAWLLLGTVAGAAVVGFIVFVLTLIGISGVLGGGGGRGGGGGGFGGGGGGFGGGGASGRW